MMTTQSTTDLINSVLPIAKKAGQKIMEIYDNLDDFEVTAKDDKSPLTIADKEANTIICKALEQLDPSIPIISEENKNIPYDVRKEYTYYWLVDPLDGTKEFIKRNGEFTVNIALVHDNMSVAGVVYAPVFDELYYAAQGSGAFIRKNGRTESLNASNFYQDEEALGVVCSRSHLNEETKNFVRKLNDPVLVSKGSSLKFLILASGGAHIYPRLAPTMEWDTAAAQIILEESGGRVLVAGSENKLVYNKEELLNPHFIAYANMLG